MHPNDPRGPPPRADWSRPPGPGFPPHQPPPMQGPPPGQGPPMRGPPPGMMPPQLGPPPGPMPAPHVNPAFFQPGAVPPHQVPPPHPGAQGPPHGPPHPGYGPPMAQPWPPRVINYYIGFLLINNIVDLMRLFKKCEKSLQMGISISFC